MPADRPTRTDETLSLVRELLDAMDGMDCADHPMVPVLCDLLAKNLDALGVPQ